METPEFTKIKAAKQEAPVPFVEMISKYRGTCCSGWGARYIDGVFFNILGVFSIGYLVNTLKVPRQTALLGVALAALVMIATIPYFGALSDRIGRRKVYAIGSIVTGLSSYRRSGCSTIRAAIR
jgi:MFS family permease